MENMPMDLTDYVDMSDALNRLKSMKVYKSLLETFLKSTEMDKILVSFEKKDYSQIASHTHAIKGMTGNLSLSRLYKTSIEKELKLMRKELIEDDINDYKNEWDRTVGYVKFVIAYLDEKVGRINVGI